ncbi:MAG: DUF4838 domain-containing protein [Candidatus Brocadiae bacterium]|nr:DUF4838 domain-containing protein [Candidatus Brocadiia bacterium]
MTRNSPSLLLCLVAVICARPCFGGLALVQGGRPAAVIRVADKLDKTAMLGVTDVVKFVEKMSGAKLDVVTATAKVPNQVSVIVVGKALADSVQPLLAEVADSEGGFVIAPRGRSLFLAGSSPLATSFACSELLERLGCRWYIPGELGEVYPKTKSVVYDGGDVVDKPDMNPRWLRVDRTWSRRNKLGGTNVPASHAFSRFVRSNEFEKHPDWFPLINGQRTPRGQLCLSNPEVVQRFVERCKEYFEKHPDAIGMSLGPNDGGGWCECEKCQAMDSGRIDPFAQHRDVTDRLIKFMNAVVKEVKRAYPDKKFGFYAYSCYQLPPVTAKPDPAVIPVFAPINYCRLHSMFSPKCPHRAAVRRIYEGWSKFGLELHYRGYTFNLAGLQTPFHPFHKWIQDMPWMHEHNIRGFFPESIESWSASAPEYYLTARLAWRIKQDPRKIIDEFCDRLFGPAGKAMNRYFWRMADAVRDADFHTGNDVNSPDIYTPAIVEAGGKDLKEAVSRARTQREKQCVRLFQMAHGYLQAFLDMQDRQNKFEFAESKKAHDQLVKLQDDLIAWDPRWLSKRAAKGYLKRFWGPAVEQAYEKTSDGNELVARLPDEWEFMLDPSDAGEWMDLYSPKLSGGQWRTLRTFSASWGDQGLYYYKGIGWYRATAIVPARFKGRKIMLWFGAMDEAVKVWVNGTLITYEAERKEDAGTVVKEARDTLSGAWRPLEVEVTQAVRFGQVNTIVVKTINKKLNELGTGGIMKVVLLYSPRASTR